MNIFYCIIDIVNFNTEMKNMIKASVNADINSLRQNNNQDKIIVIFSTHFSSPFNRYDWFSKNEMVIELQKDEWIGNE